MEYCDRGSFSRALAAMRFHEVGHEGGQGRTKAADTVRGVEAVRHCRFGRMGPGRCAAAGGRWLKELAVAVVRLEGGSSGAGPCAILSLDGCGFVASACKAVELRPMRQNGPIAPSCFTSHVPLALCIQRAWLLTPYHPTPFRDVPQFVETAGYVRWDAWACLETLKEVTKALIFLHENRILHGDLKVAGFRLGTTVVHLC